MTARLTTHPVAFVHPFKVEWIDQPQPPGIYDAHTFEGQLEGFSSVS
jgi:hypothetical protein